MGRIFTYNEIAAGNVPALSDFALIKQEITKDITACPDITGAIICGSLNHGTYNFRSDIDVMVHHNGSGGAQLVLNNLCKRATGLLLELNFIEVTPDTVESQFYDINWNFYQHLQLAAETGGLIKQNFLPHINLGDVDHTLELLNYIEFKQQYFEDHPLEGLGENVNDASQLGVLRKALEMPAHIARKYVWLVRGAMDIDHKKAVSQDYAQLVPPILGMYLRLLMAADREYTKLLKRQMLRPDKAEYERIVAGLVSLIPQIKAFAYENSLLLEGAITEISQPYDEFAPVVA